MSEDHSDCTLRYVHEGVREETLCRITGGNVELVGLNEHVCGEDCSTYVRCDEHGYIIGAGEGGLSESWDVL